MLIDLKIDLFISILYESIEGTCIKQPNLGRKLYTISLSNLDKFSEMIPYILRGLSINDFGYAYNMGNQLLQSKDENEIIIGMISLAILDFQQEKNEAEIESTLRTLDNIYSADCTEGILSAITFSYGRLLKFKDGLKVKLGELSNSRFPRVQYELSRILAVELKSSDDKEWLNKILMNLAQTSAEHRLVINKLDALLFDIAQKDIDQCYQFIESWVVNQISSIYNNVSITELFDLFFSSIEKNQISLNKYLTKWFNSEDCRLHNTAADIINCISIRHPNNFQLSLDIDYLNKIDDKEVIYILNKIMGCILNSSVLFTLVFSVLKRNPLSELIQGYVFSIFVDYIGYNFSGTRDFLASAITVGTPIEIAVATAALEELELRYKERQQLPILNEFVPSSKRVHRWNSVLNQVSQNAFNKVRSKSPLLSVATNISVKAGISYVDEKGIEIRLNQISHSSEIPRGIISDPIGQAVLRHKFRYEKKI